MSSKAPKNLAGPNKYALQVKDWMDAVDRFHKECYLKVSELEAKLKAQELGVEPDLTDIGWMLRQIHESLDESRKEVKSRLSMVEMQICAYHTHRVLMGKTKEASTWGNFASAEPNVGQQPKLPKRGTPEYVEFMSYLKIPEELIAGDQPPLSLSWEGMCEFISKRAEEGNPLPPGIEKTYPVFRATFRRRIQKEATFDMSAESKTPDSETNDESRNLF